MMTRALIALSLLVSALACGPAEPERYTEGELLSADSSVRGYVLHDLLASYFDRYQGTLTWRNGDTTVFSLDLLEEPGAEYVLTNLYDGQPRNVGYWSPARVATADGALDNDLAVAVRAVFPDAALLMQLDSVVDFSALPDFDWNAGLLARLPIDLSRYDSASLAFNIEWPPGTPAPTSGRVDFGGSLRAAPQFGDSVQVATIEFLEPD
jgi:hypothetical protein